MTLNHQLDSLIVFDPDRSSATVNVWVAHPSPSEEQALGALFVISAIDSNQRVNHEVINLIQDELRHQYYQAVNQTAEPAFETALQRTNQRLHQLIREGVGEWVDRAHFLIGVRWRDRLIVSTLGTIHGYLVRRDRLHDLVGGPAVSKPNPLRLFDQLISGQLEAGDRLIFCTPSFLDYFSLEKLRRTVLGQPPSQSVRALESALLGVDPRLSFAALLIAIETATAPAAALSAPAAASVRSSPQLSMAQLVAQEKSTENIMSPGIWPTVKDLARQFGTVIGGLWRRLLRRPIKRVGLAPVYRPTRTTATWPRRLAGSFAKLRLRTERQTTLQAATPLISGSSPVRRWGLKSCLNGVVSWFQRLAPPRRRLVLVWLALIMVLTTVLVRTGGADQTDHQRPADELATTIEQRLDQAEAALLYGGEDVARQHLDAAADLIDQLPHRSQDDKELQANFQNQLAILRNKTQRLTVIAAPVRLVDLSGNFPALKPRQIYVAAGRFVVYDPAAGTAVFGPLDAADQAVAVTNALDSGRVRTGVATETDRFIFATDRGTLVELSLDDQSWQPLDSKLPLPNAYLQSLAAYQGKLYALDTANQQIYRFTVGSSSLGSGQNWLRESTILSAARGLAVDGSIYVLRDQGAVEEYFGGRRTDFQLGAVQPALTDPTRLWTSDRSDHLYLVEPSTKRVLLFNKDGKLEVQYRSDDWTDLRDVVADEANRTVYVLNGATVYSVPLTE